jgi:hypothetical protein
MTRMASNYGPERAEAIRVLREQIRRAKDRMSQLAATADSEETSFHLRDEADIEHAAVRRDMELMDEIVAMLTGEGEARSDVELMQEALDQLRRDTEQ